MTLLDGFLSLSGGFLGSTAGLTDLDLLELDVEAAWNFGFCFACSAVDFIFPASRPEELA